MLIAQLSDLHVRPKGVLYKDVVDSNQMLAGAIAHLMALDRRPDLVLLSGDLVDEGRPDEYAHLLGILQGLDLPFLAIPGNHDAREPFRAAFAGMPWMPSSGPLHYCVDHDPVRIVALDSCVAGAHHGFLDAAALDWLQTTLQGRPEQPTLIMLHHPPFESGIPYMDTFMCRDAGAFEAVVRKHSQVAAVLCGHMHRLMMRRWGGTLAVSCPSTTTEIALRLAAQAEPASYLGPPACLLHRWDPAQGLVSHLSFIGSYPGPYPFY